MTLRLQQVFIGCVLIGTFIYFASDVFNKTYVPPSEKKAEVLPPTPEPTEAPSECRGPYLNVNEGAVWNYTIISSEESSNNKATSPTSERTKMTITLTKKELGIITFASTNTSTKKTSYTHVTCKMSGMYGLPILFSLESIDMIPKELVEEIFSQVLFIPNRRVYKDTSWTSTINISSLLPIKIQATPLTIVFNVLTEESRLIQGKKYVAVQIQSSSDTKGPINLGSLFEATYTLGEDIGLTDAEILIKAPTKSNYSVGITLQSFSNPL